MDTIQKFIEWCEANKHQDTYDGPPEQWEQIQCWCDAIEEVTGKNCACASPLMLLHIIKHTKQLMGQWALDEIQMVYNDL